eukprot:EG_transcript_34657
MPAFPRPAVHAPPTLGRGPPCGPRPVINHLALHRLTNDQLKSRLDLAHVSHAGVHNRQQLLDLVRQSHADVPWGTMSLRELRGRLDAAGVVHDGLHGRAELLALARHTLI